MELFIYTICCYSLTFGFIESELAAPFREFIKTKLPPIYNAWTYCYHCTGFWISLILVFLYPGITFTHILDPLFYALYGAGMCLIIQYGMSIILLTCKKLKK